MEQAVFDAIVKSFVEKVKKALERKENLTSAIKQALAECIPDVANNSLDLDSNQMLNILRERIEGYESSEIYLKSPTIELETLYLHLLKTTVIKFFENQQSNNTEKYFENLEFLIPTTPMYELHLLMGQNNFQHLIDWEIFSLHSLKGKNKNYEASLLLNAFSIRYQKVVGYYLDLNLIEYEMIQLHKECLGGVIDPLLQHVTQHCDLIQQTRLLNFLTDEPSYFQLAHALWECCQFDLNAILESRIFERWFDTIIKKNISILSEQSTLNLKEIIEPQKKASNTLTFRKQMQFIYTEKVILYIYAEYLTYESHRNELANKGILVPEGLLNHLDYELLCQSEDVRKRSVEDATRLYEWFKENRPSIETWYEDNYKSYQTRWSNCFITELINRCLLCAEKEKDRSEKQREGHRTELDDLFCAPVSILLIVITPYELFKTLNSFANRLRQQTILYGRETIEQKERSLLETIKSMHREAATIMAGKISHMNNGNRLFDALRNYAKQNPQDYLIILQNLLRNNLPEEKNNLLALENQILKFTFCFNFLKELPSVYSRPENPLGLQAAWVCFNGRFEEKDWRFEAQEPFSSSLTLLSENPIAAILDDSTNFDKIFLLPDLYVSIHENLVTLECLQDGENLIDKLLPPAHFEQNNNTQFHHSPIKKENEKQKISTYFYSMLPRSGWR